MPHSGRLCADSAVGRRLRRKRVCLVHKRIGGRQKSFFAGSPAVIERNHSPPPVVSLMPIIPTKSSATKNQVAGFN